MKITLDDKQCLKQHLTLQQALMVIAVREGKYEEEMNNLLEREVLIKHDNKLMVTQPWSDVLDDILCSSSEGVNEEEHLLELAKQMRQCFPEGKMPGTPYYYRCNNREVSLKLKKFFQQYSDYSDEEILDATKRFVASFKGDYRYLPLIKYFISKNKPIEGEDGECHIQEVSELASYLENKTNDDELQIDSMDWLMNSRN